MEFLRARTVALELQFRSNEVDRVNIYKRFSNSEILATVTDGPGQRHEIAQRARAGYLVKAVLRSFDLSATNLHHADLRHADLAGANLTGCDLREVTLHHANLRGVTGIIDLGDPNGWKAFAWLRDGYLSVRVGCREMRLAEGRKYWRNKKDRREVMAALDYAEAVAKTRGWKITKPRAKAAKA